MSGVDGVFNIALGHINEYTNRVANNSPATAEFVFLLLKTVEADATLKDYEDLATLLGQPGNVEADFTNYDRKIIDDTDPNLALLIDHGADTKASDFSDQTFTSAGGAANNTLVKALICYDESGAGVDANIIPCCFYDFDAITDGNDLVVQLNAAGFFRAA